MIERTERMSIAARAASFDKAIGMRLRKARLAVGLTQEGLGEKAGVTYQQIQKYETGQNRISASRLWLLAEALGMPCEGFFADIAIEIANAA